MVYDGLWRHWQVFRGSTEHWSEEVAFERLTAISKDIGFETGWTLSMSRRLKVYSPIAIGAEACEGAGQK